jgi:hypothetical protein
LQLAPLLGWRSRAAARHQPHLNFLRRVWYFLLNKTLELPANLGCRIVALPWVAARLDVNYEAAQRDFARYLPIVAENDQKIVDGLRTNGVFITSLEELGIPNTDRFLERADALGRTHVSFPHSFQAGANAIMANPEIYRWCLEDRLLDIAESYLGMAIGFDGINIFFTKADEGEGGVRLWHRDSEDRKMLKIAVYINDVDESNG